MYENFWKQLLSYSPFGPEEADLPKPKAMTEAPPTPDTTTAIGLMQREAATRAARREEETPQSQLDEPKQKIQTYMRAIREANVNRLAPPPRPNFAATTLQQLIDDRESGGDYNALLGHSQKNRFSNVKVSNMTIGEIEEFARREYGPWSRQYKAKNPQFGSAKVMSTPMGRYQFVLTTMLENAEKMGLSKDTVFSPEVQDKMFDFEVRKRIGNVSDPEARRKAIRSGWVGLDKIHDGLIDYAINNYLGQ
jgi:hypothetical protein